MRKSKTVGKIYYFSRLHTSDGGAWYGGVLGPEIANLHLFSNHIFLFYVLMLNLFDGDIRRVDGTTYQIYDPDIENAIKGTNVQTT